MLSIADHVRADFAQLDAYELVGKPTSALLGVSKPAEAALKHVGISTVFDLGASWLFANARAASEADREGTASSRFGRAPTDWLQTDVQYGSLAEISALPVQSLRGVSGDDAAALTQALDVRTIRDLAHWPPYTVARRLVGNVAGGTGDPDLVQSEALRPRFGEYPTERVYY